MPGTLSGELLRFGRALRDEGLPVTPGRMVDAASAGELIGPAQPDDFRAALRASLTTSVDQYPAFERAFDAFWLGRRVVPAVATPNMTTIENRPQGPPVYTLTRVGLEGVDPGGDARLPGGGHTAGDTEILTQKDFADYTAADTPRARRLIQQLVPSLATARSRRFESAPSGAIDMRRTVRAARRYGGDAAVLAFRRPKLRRLRLVALCDVSGSMDIYSNHLLQFCWALQQQGGGGVRTFVFSTRLRDVSGALRRRRFDDALTALAGSVETWSGGTTIGACLGDFNRTYAKELVGPRTVVMIASDGWERGDPEELGRQVALLRKRARSLIWLNPLKARAGYEPLAAGMAAALPHVDHFLAAESIQSLERLKQVLARA